MRVVSTGYNQRIDIVPSSGKSLGQPDEYPGFVVDEYTDGELIIHGSLLLLKAVKMLQVLPTAPASPTDFAAWCRETGNPLVDSSKDGKVFVFAIRKG